MTAEEDMSGGVTGYIKHHLTHLTVDSGHGAFWSIHLDSIFFTLVISFAFILVLALVARRATSGVPGKLQSAVEMLVEFVDDMVKDTYHGSNKFIAPLAITIFVIVFLENFMDILPVDALPAAAKLFGVEHLRTVATADLNTTVGMSLGVFLLIQWVGITHKGFGVFAGEWFTAPFHAHNMVLKILLAPINFAFRVIEEVVRPLSLSMRLFGNMYAGELIFLLIACFTLGAALNHISTYFLGIAQLGAGIVWTVFHYLIITLQAFIFMVLTVVYVGISAEKH
ncbi:MAG TPA: F0F1 ATP synthase subunit A [Steroidobacteraceae bacterium]|nr:F0F1 ATP synthase subunit A [Steroidobacteraceae bacterium]